MTAPEAGGSRPDAQAGVRAEALDIEVPALDIADSGVPPHCESEDRSDLTKGPIDLHLRRLAVPASVGFFFNVLFNVTDTLCAGFWSTDAQAALAFSFPLFFIVIASAVGLSQATSGMVSRSIGAGKTMRAIYYVGQITATLAFVGVFLAIVGNLIDRPLMEFLGSTDAQLELGLDYTVWIFSFSVLFLAVMVLSGTLSAHGNTHTFRNCLITASILNLLLDPMLMFGWFGLPALGMHGIGLATIIAQAMMVVWMLPVALRQPSLRGMKLLHLTPRRRGQGHIMRQAMPPTLNMAAINFGFIVNTFYLARIDTLSVAAYGIALRIEQMVLLLTIGLNIGLLSVAGQNFGARNYNRVREVHRMATKYGLVIIGLGALFMLAAGRLMVSLFNREDLIIDYGYEYLVTAALIGPFYIVAHNSTAMLQAVGRPGMIGPIGAVRLIVLPMILCWLFVIQYEMGTRGVWLSLFLANVATTIFLYYYTRGVLRQVAPET